MNSSNETASQDNDLHILFEASEGVSFKNRITFPTYFALGGMLSGAVAMAFLNVWLFVLFSFNFLLVAYMLKVFLPFKPARFIVHEHGVLVKNEVQTIYDVHWSLVSFKSKDDKELLIVQLYEGTRSFGIRGLSQADRDKLVSIAEERKQAYVVNKKYEDAALPEDATMQPIAQSNSLSTMWLLVLLSPFILLTVALPPVWARRNIVAEALSLSVTEVNVICFVGGFIAALSMIVVVLAINVMLGKLYLVEDGLLYKKGVKQQAYPWGSIEDLRYGWLFSRLVIVGKGTRHTIIGITPAMHRALHERWQQTRVDDRGKDD